MLTFLRRITGPALAAALVACASFEAGPAKGVSGRWEGHAPGIGGNAAVRLVVKDDGSYRGTLHVGTEERALHGAISELPTGRLRFDGSSGSGTVTRRERAGERVLRFQRDDGYPLFEVAARPEAPEPGKE